MPRSHGRQKQAAKQKKRRAQKKAKAAHKPAAAAARAPAAAPKDGVSPEDMVALLGYAAEVAPVPTEWLALEEKERMARVARYHEHALKPEQRPPSLPRHAALHVIVENQLAAGSPPEVGAALRRLRAEGLSRHHAIHAIGSVMADHMKQAVRAKAPVVEEAYLRDLDQLTVESWLAAARDTLPAS